MIAIDAYAFNALPEISNKRGEKATSCFIAAGVFLLILCASIITLVVIKVRDRVREMRAL